MKLADLEELDMGIMVSKILRDCGGRLMGFRCPGCNEIHLINCDEDDPIPGHTWHWNGDVDKPTFTPSINVHATNDALRCHSFVTAGMIRFLGDSYHHLKDQTVPLPDYYPADWPQAAKE